MLTGGKIGAIIGRRRAIAIGCVDHAAGSLTTALAPNLGVLILGWSFLSVVLELSAIETGIRLVPLSLALLVAAIAVPRIWPQARHGA